MQKLLHPSYFCWMSNQSLFPFLLAGSSSPQLLKQTSQLKLFSCQQRPSPTQWFLCLWETSVHSILSGGFDSKFWSKETSPGILPGWASASWASEEDCLSFHAPVGTVNIGGTGLTLMATVEQDQGCVPNVCQAVGKPQQGHLVIYSLWVCNRDSGFTKVEGSHWKHLIRLTVILRMQIWWGADLSQTTFPFLPTLAFIEPWPPG